MTVTAQAMGKIRVNMPVSRACTFQHALLSTACECWLSCELLSHTAAQGMLQW